MITAIMVDSREPEWVQHLTFAGISKVVTLLDHGDVMAATDDGNMLLIERKTPNDFLGSLRDGRLLPQLAEMLDTTRWAYLVVTGELLRGQNGNVITDRGETGWSWASVQGTLLTIQEMGVFVVFAGGDSDYESCVLRIGSRDRKPNLLLEPAKFPKILSAQEAIVASLPGIGVERVKLILDYCGTPAWAMVALTDLSTEIPGIPKNVKSKVRAALKLAENEQLAITLDENDMEKVVIASLGAQ
jgi:ERCC4-type nuclease